MDADEKEIRALVDTWMSATSAGDLDRVLPLMAEDAVFLRAGQPPMLGRKAFEDAARASWAGGQMKFDGRAEIQELRVAGDWAWMWQRLEVQGKKPDGTTTKRTGHTLTILRKQHCRWVLARDANLLA